MGKYAVPFIAACLKALARKELLVNYEESLLNVAARPFIHVKYGDPNNIVLPDRGALTQVDTIFKRAMGGNGTPVATTNNWAETEIVNLDLGDFYQWDIYDAVNREILSAGGISGLMVTGQAGTGSSFSTAQVSTRVAALRIQHARRNFEEIMNRINTKLNKGDSSLAHSTPDSVPKFVFDEIDLENSKEFQKDCLTLYKQGVVSAETLVRSHNIDYSEEVERKKREMSSGEAELMQPYEKKTESSETENNSNKSDDTVTIGRPTLDDSERNSDPASSQTGRAPKPSNPEGSEAQE